MIKLFDIRIITLFRTCVFIAAIPVVANMIVLKRIELDTFLGQIAFWCIDCLPLYYLWNNIYKSKSRGFSCHIESKAAGVITALIFFIVMHITFYMAVWHAVKIEGPGGSTTGIVFLILPLLSIIVIIIGYFIGFFIYSLK